MTDLFKQFNYCVSPAALPAKYSENKSACIPSSLVNVNIDFEHENFKLEGDWQYMISSNKHAEENWFDCHKQRVSVEANIYPGLAIDLTDDKNDGLVFIIEGIIKDETNTGNCTGLLVLDKEIAIDEPTINKWNLSFYLYDNTNSDCEIAFKLPVYGRQANNYVN